jgi:hypothetical protein
MAFSSLSERLHRPCAMTSSFAVRILVIAIFSCADGMLPWWSSFEGVNATFTTTREQSRIVGRGRSCRGRRFVEVPHRTRALHVAETCNLRRQHQVCSNQFSMIMLIKAITLLCARESVLVSATNRTNTKTLHAVLHPPRYVLKIVHLKAKGRPSRTALRLYRRQGWVYCSRTMFVQNVPMMRFPRLPLRPNSTASYHWGSLITIHHVGAENDRQV